MLLSILQTTCSDQRLCLTLSAEQAKITMFPMNWTVVHAIRESSPLWNLEYQELIARNAEFLVMVKAFDEYFGQEVFARKSYPISQLIWGAKYCPMMATTENGVEITLSRLSDTEKVPLNTVNYQIVNNSGRSTV